MVEHDTFEELLYHRLETMRTLDGESPEICRSLADETIALYIPLAERLGLYPVQSELQELSVQYGYPEDYNNLKHLQQMASVENHPIYETFTYPIRALLDEMGIEYQIVNRTKSIFSTWQKMQKDGKSLNQVYDLFAIRIIYKVPEKVEPLRTSNGEPLLPEPLPIDIFDAEKLICWRIYTAVTSIYRIQPDRIKDWVTHPKPSGYQALQVTCIGPDNNWVEVQIRSERMNYEAEHGAAAHWKYKEAERKTKKNNNL